MSFDTPSLFFCRQYVVVKANVLIYFYYFIVVTQLVKKLLGVFGPNFSQKIRYGSSDKF